jgi:hypothetical protein
MGHAESAGLSTCGPAFNPQVPVISARAMWLGVPMVAHDAIFANVEGLNLLTKLDLWSKITVQLTCN